MPNAHQTWQWKIPEHNGGFNYWDNHSCIGNFPVSGLITGWCKFKKTPAGYVRLVMRVIADFPGAETC